MVTEQRMMAIRRGLCGLVVLAVLWGLAPVAAWADSGLARGDLSEGGAQSPSQNVSANDTTAQAPADSMPQQTPLPTEDVAVDDSASQATGEEGNASQATDPSSSSSSTEPQAVEVAPDQSDEVTVEAQSVDGVIVEAPDAVKDNGIADSKASANTPTLSTQSLQVPVNQNLKSRAHVANRGWLSWQQGPVATIGATDKNRRLEAFNLSCPGGEGSIVYQAHVQRKGWMGERKDGQMAGTTGKSLRIEAVKIRLTGKLEENYDVWYRTRVADSGWLNWTCNGNPAGTQGHSRVVWELQVALVSKGAGQPSDPSDFELAFAQGEDIYNIGVERLTGDMAFDKMIDSFVRHKSGWGEKGLRRAYNIIASYEYEDQDMFYEGRMANKLTKRMAKEMYNKKRGNCYRYAALMCWVARRLGYEAETVSGHHFSGSHQWLPHGWCEITLDGKKYVIDPLYHKRFPNKKFYMVTYDKTPFKYYTK